MPSESGLNAPFLVDEPTRFVKMMVPEDNPLTQQGVALGKQLFFDPILSVDSSLSCASCHQPQRAFTDGQPLSIGVNKQLGTRNAPSLLNVAYRNQGLFWDGRVVGLEELIAHPIENEHEMANSWHRLIPKMKNHKEYPELFQNAFSGNADVSPELISKALAQYLRTLISGNSRYDQYKAGELSLSPEEDRGRRIFFDMEDGLPVAECGHCHVEPLFGGLEYFNNGLDEAYAITDFSDSGRGGVTGRNGDMGMFRAPSLRNVALTAPYMHDGRLASLEEVMDHYSTGGHYSENVNPNIRKLNLSEAHKADLIAFLHTLSELNLPNTAGIDP